MILRDLIRALEERGRIDEALRHTINVAAGMAARSIPYSSALEMDVEKVIEVLEEPIQVPGGDETIYRRGPGIEPPSHC